MVMELAHFSEIVNSHCRLLPRLELPDSKRNLIKDAIKYYTLSLYDISKFLNDLNHLTIG